MKVCDCVKDSIWYDPRVRKQIDQYMRAGVEVEGVGVMDPRYSKEEVEKIGCPIYLTDIDSTFYGKKSSIFSKIYREIKTNIGIYKDICKTKAVIIHANDLNALIPAYFAAKKIKAKIIYDTHEIFIENPWIARKKVVKYIWGRFESFLIRRVDKVVCVSNAAAEYLAKKYRIARPMVVTNCIDKERIIAEEVLKSKHKEILNHGQFYEGRGYDILVETAPLISNYTDLQIVLRGFGSMETQLRNRVNERKISNLVFAPPVKVYELIPAASSAWVGIAITEPISINFELSVSNKLFEYAAAGLPVIMSDIPEHRYLNEKFHFGIILKNHSPESIVEAILKLYNNQDLYNECSANAIKLSKEINWEKEFEKLMSVENDLIIRSEEK